MNIKKIFTIGVAVLAICALSVPSAFAQPVPGGTLDPLTIPKYVTPLVIPPAMKTSGVPNDYDIAVRQFQQQILPAGFPPTTVWSYGPAVDTPPAVAPVPAATSQFNYPAFTIETTNGPDNMSGSTVTVDWINDLVDAAGNYLPHLLPIDRSLHWANPEQLPCTPPPGGMPTPGTDCRPDASNGAILQQPYLGPVPLITHVHGAHVTPESDGYPEAWYLPNAINIPAGYATQGTLVNQYGTTTNNAPGVASFTYLNDQPSTTLWYHDHTLGMTRNNVYAGPAGFWLIRQNDGGEDGLAANDANGNPQALPSPFPAQATTMATDPNFNAVYRATIREIPIVIQDRSFNADGSLFYPSNRAFFEGIAPNQLKIPLIGDASYPSDISPIWNPEAFFNVMVVNGVSWPNLNVEPDLYRFRLLNGCNSRFLNLSLQALDNVGTVLGEVPIYQIGAEQSLLPNVVKIVTGFRTVLPGNGTVPGAIPAAAPEVALLMGLAERADVLVDFDNLPTGTTRVRMINTAPDAPFGGFPDVPADPTTTGQVMEFTLVPETAAGEGFTAPEDLVLNLPDAGDPANGPINPGARDLALIEEESILVCATLRPNGVWSYDRNATPDPLNPGTCVRPNGRLASSVPFAPKAAVLGINGASAAPTPTLWADPIATNPALNATETWELWNHTVDGHPIHLHLVKFKVANRQAFDPLTGSLIGPTLAAEVTEAGWKDTVIAYPGQVTRVNATFDIAGLYVWHCHIVEHEDNEMMVPYCVGDKATAPGCNVVP